MNRTCLDGFSTLLLLGIGLLLACSPVVEKGIPTEIQQRLIPSDPRLLDRESLFEEKNAFEWSLREPSEAAAWTGRNIDTTRADKQGLEIQTQGDDPQLIREVSLPAKSVHAIEIELTGLKKGTATLFWASEGEPFSAERRIELSSDQASGRPPKFRFDVSEHPGWRGTIARLRLDPTSAPGEAVHILKINGIQRRPRPEALASTLTESFKLDLRPEARNSWLAVPGTAIERTVELNTHPHLRFGYALEPNVLETIEFQVDAFNPESGEKIATLFERKLDPANNEAGRWFDENVDLSRYANRRLGLRFSTSSKEMPDLARGFAAWSNPEIYGEAPAERLPNIVVISLDTLRPDHLSAYGYPRPTSPKIDAWASESAVLFRNAVTQAPWTLPAHASLFTGLDAVRHGTNHHRGVARSFDLLAEILRDAGYSTAAITGGGYLRPQFGFAQGFDSFRYWPEIMAEEELKQGLGDALQWLDDNQDRRFFLFFHTYEIHYPHRRREPWFGRLADAASLAQPETDFQMREHDATAEGQWGGNYLVVRRSGSKEHVPELSPEEWKLVASMYDSAIGYTDTAVASLLERLQELGLRGKTLIVLTSDHGEALGENDLVGHNYLEDYNVLIPLIIEFPDQRGAGLAVDQQVRAVDLVPTILELLGFSSQTSLQGQSLLPLIANPQAPFSQDAWTYAASANIGLGLRQGNNLKYMYNDTAWADSLGDERLFDLRQDPSERQDLASRNPEQLARLRKSAREWLNTQHHGWRLRIRNQEPNAILKGNLTGAWRSRNKVKAVAEDCACIAWAPGRGAEFELETGQEITLYFADVGGTRSGLRGVLEGPDGETLEQYQENFKLNSDGSTRSLAYSPTGWTRTETQEPSDANNKTGFLVFTTGSAESDGAPDVPRDPEVEAQLRALGYVQ